MALRAAHALATQVVEAQAKAPAPLGLRPLPACLWREHSGEAGQRLAFVRGGGTPSLLFVFSVRIAARMSGALALSPCVVTPTCCMVSVDAAAVGGEEGMREEGARAIS